jgi:hypothetical protein
MIRTASTVRSHSGRPRLPHRFSAVAEVLEGRPLMAPIVFDPDGPGSLAPIQFGSFDFAVGNALADNSLPLHTGDTFQLYFQTTLGSLIAPSGTSIAPAGLNSTFEITLVTSVTETVTGITGNGAVATFQLAPTQRANSFIRLYYDPTHNANPLAGTGFSDGTLIFAGSPDPLAPNSSTYGLTTDTAGNPVVQNFDRFPSPTPADNDYPGIQSVQGGGFAALSATATTVNSAFFLTPGITAIAFTSQTSTPFEGQQPSRQFFDGSPTPVTPNLGLVNGVASAGGTDFQFQADSSASLLVNEAPQTVAGRMTGGGSIIDPDYGRVTYGFELHSDPRIGPNSFEINWGGTGRGSNADPGQNWHLETLVAAQGIDTAIDQGGQAKNSPIDTYVGVGLGRLNGVSGYPAVWTIVDAGEPGSNDTITIMIYDRSDPTQILLSVSGTISGGNHQSHAENKSPTLTPPPLSSLPSQVSNEFNAQLAAAATGTTTQAPKKKANTKR